jgi:hypothetical protein
MNIFKELISEYKEWTGARRAHRHLLRQLETPTPPDIEEENRAHREDMKKKGLDFSASREVQVQYVLVLVEAATPEEISGYVENLNKLAMKHRAWKTGGLGPFIAMMIGKDNPWVENFGDRFALIAELQEQLGARAKIIHGRIPGQIGMMGPRTFCTYGFAIPNFDQILGAFADIQFGEVRELSS